MTFGDFVVSCLPIVRQEVGRLIGHGSRIEWPDAMQDGILFLLESERSFSGNVREPRALARVIVRRRLISRYVPRTGGPPRPGAAPRNPRKPRVFVALPWADTDGDDGIQREQRDDSVHPALIEASPEDRVIARVTIAALRADPDPWTPIPAPTGRPRKRAA